MSGQAAPNFTLQAPASVYDPYQLALLTRMGVFRGKKVGVWGGPTDSAEVKTVDAALAKDHVHVVQTAFDSAPATDSVGQAQQDAVIAQRFQNAGIDEVVAVGQGSAGWPLDQQANQSTYNPPWIATNYNALYGFAIGSSANPVYLKNVLATTPTPAATAEWKEPLIQHCVATIEKESPGDAISSPIGQPVSDTSNQTYIAPMSACTNLGMFTAIAKAAGKNLTVSHFEKAGFGLRNVTFPGIASPVSFGPHQAYANVPIYLAHYDPALKQMLLPRTQCPIERCTPARLCGRTLALPMTPEQWRIFARRRQGTTVRNMVSLDLRTRTDSDVAEVDVVEFFEHQLPRFGGSPCGSCDSGSS